MATQLFQGASERKSSRWPFKILKMTLAIALTALLTGMTTLGIQEGFLDEFLYSLRVQPQMVLGVYDPQKAFSSNSAVLIEHRFVPWRLDNTTELKTALVQAKEANRFPLISLEPWAWNWQGMTDRTLLQDIVKGKYDSTLRDLFLTLQQEAPSKILLRWGHEMEMVGQYPWAKQDAAAYVAAYRYIVNFAHRMAVNNLLWVWSPAGNQSARAYFPGQDYVDYVGISIFAAKAWNLQDKTQALPFKDLIDEKYWVARLYRKPMIIVELGVEGTNTQQGAWLAQMVKQLPKFPRIKAVVYFNQIQPKIVPLAIGQPDWKLSERVPSQLLQDWQAAKLQSSVKSVVVFLMNEVTRS